MRFGRLGALVAVAVIAASACGAATSTPPADALGVVTIPKGEKLTIGFWGVISGADA